MGYSNNNSVRDTTNIDFLEKIKCFLLRHTNIVLLVIVSISAIIFAPIVISVLHSSSIDSNENYQAVYKNIVMISEGSSHSTGVKIKIEDKVYLYTCLHCVTGTEKFEFVDSEGNSLNVSDFEICSNRDLVRFRLKDEADGLEITDAGLKIGMDIAAYGNTQGAGVVAGSFGKVLAYGKDIVEVDAGVLQGNSGGPIVDGEGNVLALVSGGISRHDEYTKDTRFDKTRRFGVRIADPKWIKIDFGKYNQQVFLFESIRRFESFYKDFVNSINVCDPANKIEVKIRPENYKYLYDSNTAYMMFGYNIAVDSFDRIRSLKSCGATKSTWHEYIKTLIQLTESGFGSLEDAICGTTESVCDDAIEKLDAFDDRYFKDERDELYSMINDLRKKVNSKRSFIETMKGCDVFDLRKQL